MPARIVYRNAAGGVAGVITIPVKSCSESTDTGQSYITTLSGRTVEMRSPRNTRTWAVDLGLVPAATLEPLEQLLRGAIGSRVQPIAFYPPDSAITSGWAGLPTDPLGTTRAWLKGGDKLLVSPQLKLYRRTLTIREA